MSHKTFLYFKELVSEKGAEERYRKVIKKRLEEAILIEKTIDFINERVIYETVSKPIDPLIKGMFVENLKFHELNNIKG